MAVKRRSNWFGYVVIALGTLLSFLSALVPFYDAGHRLLFLVFLAGITPYLVYGLAAALLRRLLTDVAGAILLLLHGWLIVRERFLDAADYSDGAIYIAPLIFTVLLIPLVVRALREPWHG